MHCCSNQAIINSGGIWETTISPAVCQALGVTYRRYGMHEHACCDCDVFLVQQLVPNHLLRS